MFGKLLAKDTFTMKTFFLTLLLTSSVVATASDEVQKCLDLKIEGVYFCGEDLTISISSTSEAVTVNLENQDLTVDGSTHQFLSEENELINYIGTCPENRLQIDLMMPEKFQFSFTKHENGLNLEVGKNRSTGYSHHCPKIY